MSTIVDIADAVAAQLNAVSFSQAFTAERHYLPDFKLEEMDTLRVSVVPRSATFQPLDRTRQTKEYEIDIAVQHKIEPSLSNLDALMQLVEDIAGDFWSNPALDSLPARCVEIRHSPIYAAEHLQELRQFTSVLTLVYRVWS